MKIVTRIAPSPTGPLHLGTARTALFNFLFAKKMKGKFIMRIEDTDAKRSTKEFEENILNGLEWLGLSWDETYHQSERIDVYNDALEKLVEADTAYISKEPSKGDPEREVEVVRLRNPGKDITFTDQIRGDVTFNTKELGDFVIARSMTEPLYHLAVVVDDNDMEVSHVIRGEDHISNTPRQILIQEALGFDRPNYAHLPLMLGPDRSKLSKRHGATSVATYRDMGFLPEALVNYLACIGWTPDGESQELFSLEELTKKFDTADVHKSGAIFDIEKLRWYNREYLKQQPSDVFLPNIRSHLPESTTLLEGYSDEKLMLLIPEILERIHVYSDIENFAQNGDLDYYFAAPNVLTESIPGKNTDQEGAKRHLEHVADLLENLDDWKQEAIKDAVWPYAEEEGRGAVLWPMRYALTGKDRSPDPFFVASVVGKKETISRLRTASATL